MSSSPAIEKVVPTWRTSSTILRVLARSATGQEMSVYTTFSTGPKREGDLDGPDSSMSCCSTTAAPG
jgi:L-lactate dehydrogenase complex protein LldF